MAHKQKPGAEIGSLQPLNQKWRAYAKGKEGREYTPLRNTKEEALADLSVAREGATDSRDVARGLAVVHMLSRKQKHRLAMVHILSRKQKPAAEIGPATSDKGVELLTKHACNMSAQRFFVL